MNPKTLILQIGILYILIPYMTHRKQFMHSMIDILLDISFSSIFLFISNFSYFMGEIKKKIEKNIAKNNKIKPIYPI